MAHDAVSELKNFEAYLASGRAPRWTMAISDLHGFLTGIATGGAIPEGEWLPLIWSGEEPEFRCEGEEQSVLGASCALHAACHESREGGEPDLLGPDESDLMVSHLRHLHSVMRGVADTAPPAAQAA